MAEPQTPAPAPAPHALAAHAPATPLRTGLGLLLPLLSIVVLLLLMLGAMAAGLRWMLVTEGGSAWLVQHLPQLQAKGYSGALIGPTWRAESLRLSWAGGQKWLLIEGLAADGVQWQWRPHARAWLGLEVHTLTVRKLSLNTGPAGTTPGPAPTLPDDLAPRLHLVLDQLRVDEFVLDDQPAAQALQLNDLLLDPRPQALHRIGHLAFQSHGLVAAGQLQLGNAQPYPLTGNANLRPAGDGEAPRWAAVVQASGVLAAIELQATLRGRPLPPHAAPELDLRAGLRPLQPWALAHLSLQTQALDLAALVAGAPSTRLSGQATLAGGAAGSPLTANVRLSNAQPGRWNEGRLPVRQLALKLGGELSRPDRLALKDFELTLADTGGSAGRWTGSAVWQAHSLTLETRLDQVKPQRLDGRAAAMTLTGPLAATLQGLPSPDFTADSAPPPFHAQWKLSLEGRPDGAGQTVELQLEGNADNQQLELQRAHAQSGPASADFSAKLTRNKRGGLQLASTGSLRDFDPLPWWPGEAGGAWRKGPHRLSGEWQFDLGLPARAAKLPPLALAQRVAGNGQLHVQRSVLAGVPLAADITLAYAPSTTSAPATLQAELQLGGNRLLLQGRGDPAGSGESDHWQLELSADALAALAPLAPLHPVLSDWAPHGGKLNASLAADGRWPDMRSQGKAEASELKLGALGLRQGSANWQLVSSGGRPLALQLDLGGLSFGKQRADHLHAELRGTLAEHHIDISGAMPVLPPTLVEKVLGVPVQAGTRARLQAQGLWLPDVTLGGGRWKARIEQLVVGSWDGSGAASQAAPAAGWAEASDLRAELDFDRQGQLLALHATPGRLRLADAVSLRWDDVKLDWRGELPQVQLHADVDPFALAPLLARAQPGMGWQGDLRLRARIDIHAAEKMEADLVFERADGDLQIAGNEGRQALGLAEFRLAVSAHEGLWSFKPVVRGSSLGEITGELRVRSSPQRRWPLPNTPIEGQLQARVADIGIWSGWVPPGWRLAGELRSTAMLSGEFGKPLFDGELKGSGLAVRNLLQGVNVSKGEVRLKLAGDTATIEHFTLQGGDGSAELSGSARLTGKPEARLALKAERFRVLGRVDRMLTASGNAEVVMNAERTQVDGKFSVDEALYDASRADAPTLDDDVTVRRERAPEEEAAANGTAGAPRSKRSFALGLDIDLGQKTHIRGRGLDAKLTGQLRLTTPNNRLAISGTINANDGTYAAYGQKLEIERGVVAFGGPPDNPRLDVVALRPNIDLRVGVLITGNLRSPRVRLFAEPELSDAEKLSWLVLGRAPDGLGRTDTALLQRAAVALLAGEGEAPTDRLMKSLGIDEVSLRQSDGDVRETVVAVGKQLSRNWYVGYERGVNATTGSWQLIYRLAQRLTVRAQSGLDSALDVIWTWRVQETPADAGMRKSRITPP